MPSIHMGEVLLFSACTGALMHFYSNEPNTMAPFVRSIVGGVVFGSGGRRAKLVNRHPHTVMPPPAPAIASDNPGDSGSSSCAEGRSSTLALRNADPSSGKPSMASGEHTHTHADAVLVGLHDLVCSRCCFALLENASFHIGQLQWIFA